MYNHTILIIDNETQTTQALASKLQELGYEVFSATNGNDAFPIFNKERPDLIILDVLLPKMDGYEVCRRIRKLRNVPIILLTALENISNRIIGLELGADDYVIKPFSFKELEARIKSILRRYSYKYPDRKESFQFGNLTLNLERKQIKKNNETLTLTPIEFCLLELLINNAGCPLSRSTILTNIWGYAPQRIIDTRIVDIHIYKLRSKIEENSCKPDFILTARGIGYMFQPRNF